MIIGILRLVVCFAYYANESESSALI